ncbi:MAG: hypothetical protein WAU15_03515 [Nitrosomonas sp.]
MNTNIPLKSSAENDPVALTEFQLDALAETFNMSLGEAAAIFSQIVSEEIKLSVPIVELLCQKDLAARMIAIRGNRSQERLCGITQHFTTKDSFNTDTMLIFSEHGSLEIIRRMLGSTANVESITELEQDALAEIGNIIINGCMSTISNLFQKPSLGTLPCVATNTADALFASRSSDHVLLVKIGMHLASQNIDGYVLFLMDVDSIRHFVKEVEQVFKA